MIKRCPITYEPLKENERYSRNGLNILSRQLKNLHDLSFTTQELRQESLSRATKLSIQGIQPKLSAQLNVQKGRFELVDRLGMYILKPQSLDYPELPENEDLSMKLAKTVGIETPKHGLVYSKDDQVVYFIQRFDRVGKRKKVAVEDFAQICGKTRHGKYNSSMENVIKIIEEKTTFPLVEKNKFFKRTLFNYLIGNEDMHLKNFSLISKGNKIQLAPAYDFLNTTLAIGQIRKEIEEELALPLNGKKRNLNYNDLIKYFGEERLGMKPEVIKNILTNFSEKLEQWKREIASSFLTTDSKKDYWYLIQARAKVLKLD